MWQLVMTVEPVAYVLVAFILCVLLLPIWRIVSIKIRGLEVVSGAPERYSLVIRLGLTVLFVVIMGFAIFFAVAAFRQSQCSVMLTPDSGVACFREGRAVEMLAEPLQDGELVSNSSKAIPRPTGELTVVNTTDGMSIAYGTSTIGSVDDGALAVAGYYRTQSQIIAPTYIALTDEATRGDPLVGVSATTASSISAEFIGVSVKVIEWYTGRSEVIAVRVAFEETAISSDIGRDTAIRLESGGFVIVFKLISLDLREREEVRATFLMLKYPR